MQTKTWSHDVWRFRDSVIGKEASATGGNPWRRIADVIPSPNRNAYAIVFDDGSLHDMSTYDDVYIR